VNAQDEKFMRLALRLAEKGIGSVEPNPAVGCVIIKAGQEIGRGCHKQFGGPHAEINAIENCKALGFKPEGGTMYVTLEPCCHQGKTGPCTQAIIAAGIKRVVAATLDPSAHANGKGIEQLRRAGIEVEVGLCEQEAKLINAPFFKYVTTGTCWVVLKWAQSIDGKLAFADQSSEKRWITNEASRNDAHKLRRRAGAIIVGIKTVQADDPMLTPRPSKGKKPLRIVLDDSLQVLLTCRLLRTTKTSPVLIYTREETARADPKAVERITKKGAEVLTYPDTPNGFNLLFLLESLSKRGIAQVLVEGGPTVLAAFLKQGLADEICVYVSPKVLGAAGAASIGEPMADLVQAIQLRHVNIKAFDEDVRVSGVPVAMFSPQPAEPE
jgi:diaminohydroxyphosphoribosylaminopyrimidine deaminase/5-amino-6-(5-phosphoribosylamino)uracil reductase